MIEDYKSTQIGIVSIISQAITFLFAGSVIYFAIKAGDSQPAYTLWGTVILVVGLFAFSFAAFYSFTIQIAERKLTFWFGYGFKKKVYTFDEIQLVAVVKNPWYYFWGIKSIPGGWLYAIAPGGKAIELTLEDGKKIRLGTDNAEEVMMKLEPAFGT